MSAQPSLEGVHPQSPIQWRQFASETRQLPTAEVWKLRQHNEVNSGQHPDLLDRIRAEGVTSPLELSLHDLGSPVGQPFGNANAVLRGGSHRINAAKKLGISSVPVSVIDMRRNS